MTDEKLRENYEKQKQRVKDYNKTHYIQLNCLVCKELGDKIKEYCSKHEISVNQYLKQLVLNDNRIK